jgi:hypothetical protein
VLKPCLICGVPTNGSRCPKHQVKQAPRQARGYGAEYDRGGRGVREAARAAWAAGREVHCVICGLPIPNPDSQIGMPESVIRKLRLTTEHITPRRAGGGNHAGNLGPAHARCNYGWRRRRLQG